jgi:putative transposase
MFIATKIRLYPKLAQEAKLASNFGCARWVWNEALALCKETYAITGKSLTYYTLQNRLPALKIKNPWLKEADSQALQQSLQNLARAYENFFAKRGKFPKFKSKHDRQSISYPQRVVLRDMPDGVVGLRRNIYLPKIGDTKCIVHRELVGKQKTVTVSKSASGQYHAAVLVDDGVEAPTLVPYVRSAIGIDVGLTDIAVTSNGAKYVNPRHLQRTRANLKRKQQSLSRKKNGSNTRAKAKLLVAKVHQRISSCRADYLHKLSRRIVDENQVIAVETLNVKGMLKNSKLAKSISDVSWSMLSGFLEYKAERAGKAFVKVDRWFPSTKTCNDCGHLSGSKPLDVRSWQCTKCNTRHDRDINAAKNIRDEALRMLLAASNQVQMTVGHTVTASGGCVSHEA